MSDPNANLPRLQDVINGFRSIDAGESIDVDEWVAELERRQRAVLDEEVGRLYGRIGPDGRGERP